MFEDKYICPKCGYRNKPSAWRGTIVCGVIIEEFECEKCGHRYAYSPFLGHIKISEKSSFKDGIIILEYEDEGEGDER